MSTRPLLRSACGIAQRDARGKIEIYIQRNQPVDVNHSHWLPVQAGPFKVVLNVFWPSEAILNGGWIPPTVELRS